MAAALKPHPGDLPGLVLFAGRLLARAVAETAEQELPVARLAAERCVAHLADCTLRLGAASRRPRAEERARDLEAAERDALLARAALELLGAQGGLAPPALRALAGGFEVLCRRFDGGGTPHLR